jgi:type IV pilus assembly protein PilX
MKSFDESGQQRGVALVVALLFLLVVTVISVIAASNSSLGLKMAANMADSYSSFQSAEAGVIATLSLAGDPNSPLKPFDGKKERFDLFGSLAPNDPKNPLKDLNDTADSVEVDVFLTNAATACPRSKVGSSVGLFDCDYYRIASEHKVPKKARTKVNLGVVKTIIGGGIGSGT